MNERSEFMKHVSILLIYRILKNRFTSSNQGVEETIIRPKLIKTHMKTIKNLERLQQLHSLIENEVSGSPRNIANRMHISERLVYHLIGQLRDYKAAICYDRGRETYYYLNEFHLRIDIAISVSSNNEITRIFGKHPLAS